MRKKQLAIMVPWDSPFTWSKPAFNLMNLERPDGYEVRYIQGDGWCPANRHNNCLIRAINWGADRMVFMGMDHHVDEDCLIKLVGHIDDGGYDAACGWLASRAIMDRGTEDARAFPYIAFKKKDGVIVPPGNPALNMDLAYWDRLEFGAESQEIDMIGSGMIMVKRNLIINMKTPFFREFIRPGDHYARVPIQDSFWVWRLTQELGGSLWLDTTIEAVHLDLFPIDHTYSGRFDDMLGGSHYTPYSKLGPHPYEVSGHPRLRGEI